MSKPVVHKSYHKGGYPACGAKPRGAAIIISGPLLTCGKWRGVDCKRCLKLKK